VSSSTRYSVLIHRLGVPGDYENPLVLQALERILNAAQNASTKEKTVYVGFGGLEPRPDLIKKLRAAHSNVGFVMAGRDLGILLAGMTAQATAMRALS
jgi:hypothetical protein